jgi:hypothetical protein
MFIINIWIIFVLDIHQVLSLAFFAIRTYSANTSLSTII